MPHSRRWKIPHEDFLTAHGWRARHVLREQLVALEVVSDNL